MSIMACYPDKRAIENELGGKWELFFEETREEAGDVGYEWDKDHNDNTPLNLNGICVVLTNEDQTIVSRNSTLVLTLNDKPIIDSATTFNFYSVTLKSTIKNNMLNTSLMKSSDETVLTSPLHSIFGDTTIIDNINKIAFSMSGIQANTNLKFYVLRGV